MQAMAVISRYSLGSDNVPGAVSGPRNHPGTEARGFQGKRKSAWAGGLGRGSLEEGTWAGAGKTEPGFASPPASKVSTCHHRSVWILTQPRGRSVSIQLSDVGLILRLSLGPDSRIKKPHPIKGPQVTLTSGPALVQLAMTAPTPEPCLDHWFKSYVCHLQLVTLNLSLFFFFIVKPI